MKLEKLKKVAISHVKIYHMSILSMMNDYPEDVALDKIRNDPSYNNRKIFLLRQACRFNKIKIVKYLVEKGTYLGLTNFEKDMTPLHIACQQDNKELISYLLDKDISGYDHRFSASPLFHVSKNGYKDLAQRMMKYHGFKKDDEAIFHMFRHGWEDLIIEMINDGFHIDLKDVDGCDVFDYSQTCDMPKVSSLIATRTDNSLAKYFIRKIKRIRLERHFYKDIREIVMRYI